MTIEQVPTESSIKITPLGDTKVFKPFKVGDIELNHRIVFPPTTRFRGTDDHCASDLNYQYYDERSRVPGTLLVTEGTLVSPFTGIYRNVPGIWTDDHVKSWRKITDKVHENKSFMTMQLWALGKVAEPDYMKELGYDLTGPSALYFGEEHEQEVKESGIEFREYTASEIERIKDDYVHAAKYAIKAGFDIVELHSAHGYLLDTFLQYGTNKRTDKYGGSIENRARLGLEIVDKLISEIGAHRLAIRLSPFAQFQGMKGVEDEIHPYTSFGYFIHELQKRANNGNELAYVSIVEPRVNGYTDIAPNDNSNQFILDIWKGKLLRAGSYSYDAPDFHILKSDVDDDRTMIGFARYFVSNPDLPHRLKLGLNLVPYHREVFYNKTENWGYNTYGPYGEIRICDVKAERARRPKRLDI